MAVLIARIVELEQKVAALEAKKGPGRPSKPEQQAA